MSELISLHGGYRNLKSFQVAQLCYDITVRFCDAYVDRFSRTKDQMVQAARWIVGDVKRGSGHRGPSGPGGSDDTPSTESTTSTLSTKTYPEYSANAALVLLAVACSLLDRQVERLAQDFENEGGFTERLYKIRTQKLKQRRVGDSARQEATLSKAEVLKEFISKQTLPIEIVLKRERMDRMLVRNGGND